MNRITFIIVIALLITGVAHAQEKLPIDKAVTYAAQKLEEILNSLGDSQGACTIYYVDMQLSSRNFTNSILRQINAQLAKSGKISVITESQYMNNINSYLYSSRRPFRVTVRLKELEKDIYDLSLHIERETVSVIIIYDTQERLPIDKAINHAAQKLEEILISHGDSQDVCMIYYDIENSPKRFTNSILQQINAKMSKNDNIRVIESDMYIYYSSTYPSRSIFQVIVRLKELEKDIYDFSLDIKGKKNVSYIDRKVSVVIVNDAQTRKEASDRQKVERLQDRQERAEKKQQREAENRAAAEKGIKDLNADYYEVNASERAYNPAAFVNGELSVWSSSFDRYRKSKAAGIDTGMAGLYVSMMLDFSNLIQTEDTGEEEDGKKPLALPFDAFASYAIRISDNFYIPLYFAMWGASEQNYTHLEGGGGLIFAGNFGSVTALGGFAANLENTPDMAGRFYLIPRIDVSRYPLIGAVFKLLASYIGFDTREFTGTQVSLSSKMFLLGKSSWVSSFDVNYDYQKSVIGANVHQFGFKSNFFKWDDILVGGFTLDGGYRLINPDNESLSSTPYGKIGAYLRIINPFIGQLGIYAFFNAVNFPLPMFGFDMKFLSPNTGFALVFFAEGGRHGGSLGFRVLW